MLQPNCRGNDWSDPILTATKGLSPWASARFLLADLLGVSFIYFLAFCLFFSGLFNIFRIFFRVSLTFFRITFRVSLTFSDFSVILQRPQAKHHGSLSIWVNSILW
jgi:hypothetical protein